MGRHKDPDTLSFIENLRRKGELLGFVAETEYKLYKDEYFVDLVWKLQKDQSPLFTFEIETEDNAGVFSNTSKIFGTSSNIITKPWRHFMIIYKTNLSAGHRKALHNVLNQHNILLFENLFNEKVEKERLDKALKNCTYDISELIKSQLRAKPLGEALPSVLKGLSMGLDDGIIKDPEISFTIKSRASPEEGTEFSIVTETPSGEPTFLDKLREAKRTLAPFTIESPQLKDFVIDGKSVLPTKPTKAKLTITPRPLLLKSKIVVPGTNVVFNEILFRNVKTEGTMVYVSTEDRNIPFIFEFNFDKEKKKGQINFRFEPSTGNVKQAFHFEEFIKALNANKELHIVEPEKNALIVRMHFYESFEQSEQWYDILSKLAYIQEKTNHSIPCPSKVTREEIRDIYAIVRVINTGEDHGTINKFSVKINKQGIINLLTTFRKENKISNLVISQSSTFGIVCGENVPLGPSKMKLPDMQFVLPIEEVEGIVEKASDGSFIEVALKPIVDDKIVIEFENWLPKT